MVVLSAILDVELDLDDGEEALHAVGREVRLGVEAEAVVAGLDRAAIAYGARSPERTYVMPASPSARRSRLIVAVVAVLALFVGLVLTVRAGRDDDRTVTDSTEGLAIARSLGDQWLWPAVDHVELAHDHKNLDENHPHLSGNDLREPGRQHAHAFVIDDDHQHWPR